MSSPQSSKGPPRPPPPKPPKIRANLPSLTQHLDHLQELRVENVRWFYKEEKMWVRFNGADSSLIEMAYRQLKPSLQGPPEPHTAVPADVSLLLAELGDGQHVPVVRGGLYEVDIPSRACNAIYWKEDAVDVLRGTWFKGGVEEYWEPLDERDAEKVETAHQEVVRAMGLNQDGVPLPLSPSSEDSDAAIHKLRLGCYRVEWHDLYEVNMISESTGSKWAQKIGLGVAWKLHRGFYAAADMWDCDADVTHLVFCVHGIGQMLQQTGGIVHSRKKFREVVDKTIERSFKDATITERVEFFPVEWRSSLKLDEGIIAAITPENISGLRKLLNETTMDVMYYTSAYYKEEIIKALRQQLNDLYVKFCQQNPSFEANNGKVSIIAHSLGSVIVHDLLTMWNTQLLSQHAQQADNAVADVSPNLAAFFSPRDNNLVCDNDTTQAQLRAARLLVSDLEARLSTSDSRYVEGASSVEQYSLKFKVESVFNFGSPLGVFLVMKGIRPRNDIEQHVLPASVCKRYYNVYDPADPVAYRLEPLIYDYYAKIPPVKISYYNRQTDRKTADLAAKAANSQTGQWLRSLLGGFASQAPQAVEPQAISVEYQADGTLEMPKATHEKVEEILKDKKRLAHRLDYALDGGMMEYFTALTSHMSYWSSMDVARFVLNRIYGRDEEQQQQQQ